MSTKGLAALYAAGKLRGDRDTFTDPSATRGTLHLGHHGVYLQMHSAPCPSVDEYETWLAGHAATIDARGRALIGVTGSKLRRMAVMRRAGSTYAQCGRAVGIDASTAKKWLGKLPVELGA